MLAGKLIELWWTLQSLKGGLDFNKKLYKYGFFIKFLNAKFHFLKTYLIGFHKIINKNFYIFRKVGVKN